MASEPAETYLRLMAQSELRRAARLPRVRKLGSRPSVARLERDDASEGLFRLARAADALVAADAIDGKVAHHIVARHEAALRARRRYTSGYGVAPGRRKSAGPPAGSFRAVGIGERVRFDTEAGQAEVLLLALVIAPDRAMLSIVAKPPPPMDTDECEYGFLDEVEVRDDDGDSYHVMFSGGGDDDEWTGEFDLLPTPGPDVRYLDVAVAPGLHPVRIDLDRPQPAQADLPVRTVGPAGWREQYFDSLTAKMLGDGALWELREVLHTLLDAQVIDLTDPAIGRLVAVGRRLDADLPSGLSNVPDAVLPERWVSVLDHNDAADGPAGVVAATVVLPEVDNARWVIGALRSMADRAELKVFGWGPFDQLDRYRTDVTLGKFVVWALDDRGRWHVATMTSGGWDQGFTDLTIELTPALHPEATSLEVTVTGRTGQVTVTLPLDWRALDQR